MGIILIAGIYESDRDYSGSALLFLFKIRLTNRIIYNIIKLYLVKLNLTIQVGDSWKKDVTCF